MAGIGFILRKLSRQDNYMGILRAYFHSIIAAVGPWIMVVVSLSVIFFFTRENVELLQLNEFLSVVIYNLLFSFIFSSPIYMIAARYVADCLFKRNASPTVGILITGQWYQVVPAIVLGIPFYVFYADMSPMMTILSIINFVMFAETWFVMLYLSCIRNFRAITLSWVIGIVIGVLLGIYLGRMYKATGMLFGLTTGLAFILYSLKANILSEYPYRFSVPKEFRFYFRHYKGLFFTGFFLFAGMWVDKVIMWGTPQATIHINNLRTYPIYDGAMFFSYISIIPVMGLFIFSLETNFYDSYYLYLRNIETNAPYASLEQERNNMIAKIIDNGRSFLILQGSLSLVVILLAPKIYDWFNFSYLQLGIFRLGTLGAFFSALNFFIVILFSYFDSQENMLIVTITMFLSNTVFTLITIMLGFAFYGYGFAFSMILTFAVGGVLLTRFLQKLHYKIFISNVVKRVRMRGPAEIQQEERGTK